VAWLRGGDRTRARRAFSEMLVRWPGSTHVGEAHVALGWLLFERRELTAAKAEFEAAQQDSSARVRDRATAGLAAIAKAR
jgi:TolA-binding protein